MLIAYATDSLIILGLNGKIIDWLLEVEQPVQTNAHLNDTKNCLL